MKGVAGLFGEMHKGVGELTEGRLGIHPELPAERCTVIKETQHQTNHPVKEIHAVHPVGTLQTVHNKVPY